MTGELGRRFTQLMEDCMRLGRTVPGLVALRHICNWYKSGDKEHSLFEYKHLEQCVISNGNLELFQSYWIMVNTGLKNPLSQEQLEEIYFDKIKNFVGLKEDIAHYQRLDEQLNHPDRSYHYLYGIVEKYIERTRRENVKRSREKGLGPMLVGAVPGAPARGLKKSGGKGNGKGKGNKGKGKGKNKDKGKGKGTGNGKGKKGRKGKGSGRSAAAPTQTPAELKQIPCRFFARGGCRHQSGKDCPYSHSAAEQPAQKKPNPKQKGKGNNKGKSAPAVSTPAPERSWKKDFLCKKFMNGTCTKDHATCEHSHSKKLLACKTRACPAHIAGQCLEKSWCRYSHDPAVCRDAASSTRPSKANKKSKAMPCVVSNRPNSGVDASLTAGVSSILVPISVLTDWEPLIVSSLTAGDDAKSSDVLRRRRICAANRVSRGPPAAPVRTKRSRRWLMDTGCGHDIICKSGIGPHTRVYDAAGTVGGLAFETANGVINADSVCDLVLPKLFADDAHITPYVLPDSPDLLSIGRRCVQDGYGFYWAPYSKTPALIPPESSFPRYSKQRAAEQWIWLETEDDVPYLVDTYNPYPETHCSKLCPAPSARAVQQQASAGTQVADLKCPKCGDSPWTAVEQSDGTWQLVASLDIAPSLTACGVVNKEPPAAAPEIVSLTADGPGVAAAAAREHDTSKAAPGVAAETSDEAVPPPPVAPRDWKAEAASLEHMLTHKPYNIYCDICRRSKPQRKAKPDRAKQRARAADGDPIAGRDKLAFGDRCTGDYFLQRRSEYKGSKEKNPDESAQFPGATCAVVFFDLGTDWRETLPRCTRSSEETRKAVQHFEGPDEKVKQMYCDGAPELKRAMADVGIINPTSTPGCPATNGIAEACVKDSKNGTRCAHIQAGFEASWWERAATCYSFHTNITPRSRWAGDAKASAYERRHLEKCKAQLIPHGALVDFMPVPFPQNTPAPFAARAIPGLMVDLEVHPGGVWSGDYWIVEYEPLRKEPELPLAVAMHRGLLHRTKEVWLVREGGSIRFPLGERRTMLARLPPGMHAAEGDPLYDVAGTADAVAPAEGLLTGAAPSTEPPQDDVSPSAGPQQRVAAN